MISIYDSVKATVTGGCSTGVFLDIDGCEGFANFGGLNPGSTVICTVLKPANEKYRRILVSIDSIISQAEAA